MARAIRARAIEQGPCRATIDSDPQSHPHVRPGNPPWAIPASEHNRSLPEVDFGRGQKTEPGREGPNRAGEFLSTGAKLPS